jgi:hypothetical protein
MFSVVKANIELVMTSATSPVVTDFGAFIVYLHSLVLTAEYTLTVFHGKASFQGL